MKSKIMRFLAALMVPLLGACAAFGPPEVVKEKIKSGALVVDVRTTKEFAKNHYPGAKHIPVDEVEKRIAEFGDKAKPIVVYCASGARSGRAKAILEKAGYSDVTNAGGLSDMPK